MAITSCIEFIFRVFHAFINFLERIQFTLFGFNISFAGVLFAFLVLAMAVSIFWRGAKA